MRLLDINTRTIYKISVAFIFNVKKIQVKQRTERYVDSTWAVTYGRAYFSSGHSLEPYAYSWVLISAQGLNNPASPLDKSHNFHLSAYISSIPSEPVSSQQAPVKVNAYFSHSIFVVFPNGHLLARNIFSWEA